MNERLMAAIPFSPEDLAANKQGHLTQSQKRRLEIEFSESVTVGRKFTYCLWAAAVLFLILVLVVGPPGELVARFARSSFKREPDTLRSALFGLFSAAVVAAGISWLFLFIAHMGRRNMTSDLPVFSIAGMVEKSEYESWYTVKIKDREFVYGEANDAVYEAFETGKSYRVHYISSTRAISLFPPKVAEGRPMKIGVNRVAGRYTLTAWCRSAFAGETGAADLQLCR